MAGKELMRVYCIYLTFCLLVHAFVICSTFSKLNLEKKKKKKISNTIRVWNGLDPDQIFCCSVGPDLGQNCLQRLTSDNKRKELSTKISCIRGFNIKCWSVNKLLSLICKGHIFIFPNRGITQITLKPKTKTYGAFKNNGWKYSIMLPLSQDFIFKFFKLLFQFPVFLPFLPFFVGCLIYCFLVHCFLLVLCLLLVPCFFLVTCFQCWSIRLYWFCLTFCHITGSSLCWSSSSLQEVI